MSSHARSTHDISLMLGGAWNDCGGGTNMLFTFSGCTRVVRSSQSHRLAFGCFCLRHSCQFASLSLSNHVDSQKSIIRRFDVHTHPLFFGGRKIQPPHSLRTSWGLGTCSLPGSQIPNSPCSGIQTRFHLLQYSMCVCKADECILDIGIFNIVSYLFT